MKKTVQLGLRIDVELLQDIEEMAEYEQIDKMSWIRRALAAFLGDERNGMKDAAIKDYLNLRIDDKEFIETMGIIKIPADLQTARKETLERIKKDK